jgi:hypothetical protein
VFYNVVFVHRGCAAGGKLLAMPAPKTLTMSLFCLLCIILFIYSPSSAFFESKTCNNDGKVVPILLAGSESHWAGIMACILSISMNSKCSHRFRFVFGLFCVLRDVFFQSRASIRVTILRAFPHTHTHTTALCQHKKLDFMFSLLNKRRGNFLF